MPVILKENFEQASRAEQKEMERTLALLRFERRSSSEHPFAGVVQPDIPFLVPE